MSELKLVRSTIGVVTNARPDHLEVMGPSQRDVARALSGTTPVAGKLYTTELTELDVFAAAARDRGSQLISIDAERVAEIGDAELSGFSYTEHPENVALALAVCEDLGVSRGVALAGMQRARCDPGALTEHVLEFFGKKIVFVNGFAANDPVSSEQLWQRALERHPELETKIALFNCRVDRPERSRELGKALASWAPADRVVLMGSGTYLFARAATRAGLGTDRLLLADGLRDEDVFERVVSLIERSALVVGLGNIGGQGLSLLRHFKNRALPAPPSGRASA